MTLFVNWLVKPFSMALPRHGSSCANCSRPWLPAEQIDSYVAGLILLAAAPCTAMVFVWSRLTNGDPMFTLTQVALNDSIMVVAFAPIVGLLLGIAAISVPWDTLHYRRSSLYIVIPVIAGAMRGVKVPAEEARSSRIRFDDGEGIGPWSITVRCSSRSFCFSRSRARPSCDQPLDDRAAGGADPDPGFLQFLAGVPGSTASVGEKHNIACPSALIGASNFFELAVAAAISLFGFESGAALATVVGVLIEVPVMLLVVRVVNASKGWYERA